MGSGIPGLAAIAGMTAAPNHPTPAIAGMRWNECGATFEALVVGSVVANDAMGAPGETRLQLQWVRAQPRTTFHGAMGWAVANDGLGVRRIHVCAHSPCTHSQSAWAGVFAELPTHVRRVGAPRLGLFAELTTDVFAELAPPCGLPDWGALAHCCAPRCFSV